MITEAFARKPTESKFDSNGKFMPSVPYLRFPETKTRILVPTGNLYTSTMEYLSEIGLTIPSNQDPRDFEIPVENMDVILVPFRSREVPLSVLADNSDAKAGITGSDIIMEKGLEMGIETDEGEILPFNEIISTPPKSSLYLGITTKQDREKGKDYQVSDLSNNTIVTIYPNITNDYIKKNGLTNTRIFEVEGQDEAYQYIYPYRGVLGIKSTGRSIEANQIKVLDEFFNVTVKMITYGTDKLTTRDLQILNDLREMTYLALKKRGMV